MAEFKYQFQLNPNDLKVIRDTTGIVRFSPGTSITVWATGFVVCLLILGIIGSWSMIWMMMFFGLLFVSWYVKSLNRRSVGDREFFTRTVTFSDSGVVEEFGDSMFEKSWDAFEQFDDAQSHFLLQHYEKITTVPKRAVPADELEPCRDFIQQQLARRGERIVDKFYDWFKTDSRYSVFKFRWRDEDITKLGTARLRVYDSKNGLVGEQRKTARRSLATAILLLLAVGAMVFFNASSTRSDEQSWFRLILFAFAIGFPFAVALGWWKYTVNASRNRTPRIPDQEICVRLDESGLKIGYPQAVASYSWSDISSFHYCDDFIGFRPKHGLVHVIANHAFGGKTGALEFLQLADQLANGTVVGESFNSRVENSPAALAVEETGNPFQPPGYLN